MQMMKKVDKVAQMILEDMMENMSLDCFLKSKTVMKVIIVEVIIGVQSIGKCKEKSFTCENCLMACMICFILCEENRCIGIGRFCIRMIIKPGGHYGVVFGF